MTRQTSLHGWTVPTEGDADYENTFDDFFVDLDTNGEIRDVESNLSNYSPKSGAKFVATDTENEYIGDGNNWNQLQTSGKNPNFNSVNTDKLSHSLSRNTVAGSRDLNTVYQNNSDVMRLIIVRLENATGSTADLDATLRAENVTPPTTGIGFIDITVDDGKSLTIWGLVGPSEYYELVTFGVGSIQRWIEVDYL
jgi:hypothetical protein